MLTDPVIVLLILTTVVFVAILLQKSHKLFSSLGPASLSILIAMLLSNIGILPGESPTYEFIFGPGLSAGIVLILLGVDIRSIMKAGPLMLKAFLVGAVGTAVGSGVMAFTLAEYIGPETWKLSGQFTGTYTGGGMNFAAIGRTLGTNSDLFTAAIAADVIITAVWMIACLLAPVVLGRKTNASLESKQSCPSQKDAKKFTLERALNSSGRSVELIHLAALVAIAIGAQWLAGVLADWFSFLPKILWMTTIVLMIAQLPIIKRLSGSAMIGNYLLLLFLACNGAQSVIANIIRMGPAIFIFAVGVVAIHGIVIFGIGLLLRIDPGTLAVASQANVGGSASAVALATARGYTDKLLPGVAVGLLGYAVGNYLGLAVANLMKALL